MADYSGAIWLPNNNFFPNTGKKSFLILHGTAGGYSSQGIANYFKGTEGTKNPVASNYIVDQAGVIVQTVLEKDGAYAQGVVTNPNWQSNPNDYCISIEHVKTSTDNSDALTPAQQAASFPLIKDICKRNKIGMHDADNQTGITGHFSIDPINREHCPGTFPWQELWKYLQGEPMPLTQFQQQAADEEWDCILKDNSEIGVAPKGTGIYQTWLADYQQGIFYGPPVGHERTGIDWNGNPIIKQQFQYAHVEWSHGLLGWYPPKG
jgi:Negative regulator of beta-lactamase expression